MVTRLQAAIQEGAVDVTDRLVQQKIVSHPQLRGQSIEKILNLPAGFRVVVVPRKFITGDRLSRELEKGIRTGNFSSKAFSQGRTLIRADEPFGSAERLQQIASQKLEPSTIRSLERSGMLTSAQASELNRINVARIKEEKQVRAQTRRITPTPQEELAQASLIDRGLSSRELTRADPKLSDEFIQKYGTKIPASFQSKTGEELEIFEIKLSGQTRPTISPTPKEQLEPFSGAPKSIPDALNRASQGMIAAFEETEKVFEPIEKFEPPTPINLVERVKRRIITTPLTLFGSLDPVFGTVGNFLKGAGEKTGILSTPTKEGLIPQEGITLSAGGTTGIIVKSVETAKNIPIIRGFANLVTVTSRPGIQGKEITLTPKGLVESTALITTSKTLKLAGKTKSTPKQIDLTVKTVEKTGKQTPSVSPNVVLPKERVAIPTTRRPSTATSLIEVRLPDKPPRVFEVTTGIESENLNVLSGRSNVIDSFGLKKPKKALPFPEEITTKSVSPKNLEFDFKINRELTQPVKEQPKLIKTFEVSEIREIKSPEKVFSVQGEKFSDLRFTLPEELISTIEKGAKAPKKTITNTNRGAVNLVQVDRTLIGSDLTRKIDFRGVTRAEGGISQRFGGEAVFFSRDVPVRIGGSRLIPKGQVSLISEGRIGKTRFTSNVEKFLVEEAKKSVSVRGKKPGKTPRVKQDLFSRGTAQKIMDFGEAQQSKRLSKASSVRMKSLEQQLGSVRGAERAVMDLLLRESKARAATRAKILSRGSGFSGATTSLKSSVKTRQRFTSQVQRFLVREKPLDATKTISRDKTALIGRSRDRLKSGSSLKLRESVIPREVTAPQIKSIPRDAIITTERLASTDLIIPRNIVITSEQLLPSTQIPPVTILKPGETLVPPPPVLPIEEFKEEEAKPKVSRTGKKVEGYHAFVKDEPFKNAKFIKVTKRALPKEIALEEGFRAADNTISQTVKLVKTKKKVPNQPKPFLSLSQKFRESKKKDRFIERRAFAIDTIGEKEKLRVSKYLKTRNKGGITFGLR